MQNIVTFLFTITVSLSQTSIFYVHKNTRNVDTRNIQKESHIKLQNKISGKIHGIKPQEKLTEIT